MLEQRVSNPQPGALQGAGIVLLIALASVGFILYGCVIAWMLMDRFALSYVYTANADCLRVCRAYGKRERFMLDVWLNQVKACGAPDEMKKRFPGARIAHATRAKCPLAPLALAYQAASKTAILVIQPDDALRQHLVKAVRGK